VDREKIQLNTLVKRLFAIDAKLNGETAELVSEYNQIVEEIYMTIGDIKKNTSPPKILSIQNRGGRK